MRVIVDMKLESVVFDIFDEGLVESIVVGIGDVECILTVILDELALIIPPIY